MYTSDNNIDVRDKFLKWKSDPYKEEGNLISDLLGVCPEAVEAVYNKSVGALPCIYLFSIGQVKDLRKSLKINLSHNDNEIVYRWGVTLDIEARTLKYISDFAEINGSNLQLLLFGFVDIQHIFKTESRIKHLIKRTGSIINNVNIENLVIMSRNIFELIKDQYNMLSMAYMENIGEIIYKIKDKDFELNFVKKDLENKLLKKENDRLKKDNDMLKKDNELALIKKDLEIAKLKKKK